MGPALWRRTDGICRDLQRLGRAGPGTRHGAAEAVRLTWERSECGGSKPQEPRIRFLKALHGPLYQETRGNADPTKIQALIEANPAVAQPVARIHPDSDKPVLFVNFNYTGPIVGMENKEGEALRHYLFDQFKKPDYQMRVRWQPNTIVVWDNRLVQHYAVYDYDQRRHMERILVTGVEPAIGFADVEREPRRAMA